VSIAASTVTITTSPTLIATGLNGASWIYLHAPTGGNTVFVGPSNVTTATGLELPKGALQSFWLAETDKLYGIVATSTQPLMTMQSGGR
jgi:hypothetical protein